ncbi:retention module-containing protein [Aromatoleum toluolicum]|uniref:Retention module-containing protein n=1 Tax=Aromatoleum toluolicum TaxID=90060 RepID=A0ABX1NMJ4_9RHOO|nr:retention module-containing protein [Aromatoleum toluolicum]NMG00447.1 retention module-containing protein [Aromatoleum toluolicum]
MAQAIAVVVAVTGRAFARDVKGNLRPLKAGDTLQEGEVVITMSGGHVELAMADGAPMEIAADQTVTLTAEVSATTRPGREDAQVSQDTVDRVIQALEQGGNLDDIEAPAAGLAGGGGGEGNSFVRLLRITEGVNPLEFRFAQESTALLQPEESAPITEEPEPLGATVTLGDVTVFEGSGTATITATVNSPVTGTDLVITLSNGAVIVIPVGSTTGTSTPFPIQDEDPYIDAETFPVSVVDTSGSGFGTVTPTGPATVVVNDTIDPTNSSLTVTLEAAPSLTEDGATLTYVVTLSAAVRPGDDPVTITFTDLAGNTQTIVISEGTSGSIAVPIPESLFEDVYKEADAVLPVATNVAISGGSDFEALSPPTVGNVTLVDTIDVVTVRLSATLSTSEDGGSITYTAALFDAANNPVTTANAITVTLDDNSTITIAAGASSGTLDVAVNRDDVYLETDSISRSIANVSEANAGTVGAFESLTFSNTPATTTIVDDSDAVTVRLSATLSTSEDGGSITYTAALFDAANNPVTTANAITVTLDDNSTITIAAGASSGTLDVAVNRDDVYLETDSISRSIANVSEANAGTVGAFESLTFSNTPATTTIVDDSDPTTLTLTGSANVIPGGTITYTATLDHEVRAGDAPVLVTLSNDLSFEITSGNTGSITTTAPNDGITPSIGPVTATATQTVSGSQGSFEALTAVGTVMTDINYTPSLTTSNQTVDETGGLDSVVGTLAVNYGGDAAGTLALAAANATWSAGTQTLTANDGSWKVTVNGNGTYTFTQLKAMAHPDALNPDDPIDLTITANVVDGDGSAASQNFTVTVLDDGPTVTGTTNLIFSNQDATTGASGIFAYDIGTDARTTYSGASSSDFRTVALVSGLVGTTPITIGATPVTWVSETNDEAVFSFTFQYAANPLTPGILSAASGLLIFDKDAGTYTVKLDAPVQSFTVLNTGSTISKEEFNLVGNAESQPEIVVSKLADDFYVRFTGTSGSATKGTFGTSSGDSAFTPNETFSGPQDYVNVNTTQSGVGDGVVGPGEVLNMEFYTSSPGNNQTPVQGTARADALYLKIAQFHGTEDFVVVLKLVDPDNNQIITRAIVVDSGDIFTGTNPYGISLGNGEGVVIIESNDFNGVGENYQIYGAQLLSSTENVTGSGINLNRDTGSTGASTGTQTFETSGGPTAADTSDNDVVKFTDIGFLSSTTSTQDTKLTFGVTVADADGDTTATQTLSVTIEGNTHFLGTASADVMYGSDGNDTLQAGAGSDTIYGGAGADTFKWSLADASSTTVPTDIIKDFNNATYSSLTEGDRLDLKDLLEGASAPIGSLDNYLHFSKTGTSTTIEVRSGGSDGVIDQMIVLENIDLTNGGTLTTDQAIINDLISKGKLITD